MMKDKHKTLIKYGCVLLAISFTFAVATELFGMTFMAMWTGMGALGTGMFGAAMIGAAAVDILDNIDK